MTRWEPVPLDEAGVYVVECDRALTSVEAAWMKAQWSSATSARLIILGPGMTVWRKRRPWWRRKKESA